LKTNKKSYPFSGDIQIPYTEAKNITISFSTLSFGGKNISYQYSVSKNDQDNWRDITGDINLANTDYGTYTIKVKAKTISSDYCEPVVFTLSILRPFWATWWFIALCICVMITIILLIVFARIVQMLQKKRKEHLAEIRFIKSEYRALNALMNPHFIFNTLNNVQALVNRNDKVAANNYLRIFADLIRQNMQNVSKELIPLEKEMSLIRNYLILEKLRFEDNLNYIIDIDEGLDLSEIMVPPLLIQPLVENSIKHGLFPMESADSIICIGLHEQDGILIIEVKVGLGNPQNKKDPAHESFGLENIRQRIRQLSIIQNKEIIFNITDTRGENDKVLWTIVTISMPISE
jgi:two-component sensor histidine kinase